mgnify:CR=1 FL=1
MLETNDVNKSFGGLRALSSVSVSIARHTVTAVIGPNGAGKSTLMNVISGFIAPDTGTITVDQRSIVGMRPHGVCAAGVARTFQNLQMFSDMTALEAVATGRHLHRRTSLVAELLMLPVARRTDAVAADEADALLDRLAVPAEYRRRRAGDLPYGLQRRVEIARALATEPAYLLLDEPAAGLNDEESAALGRTLVSLARDGLGIALIEHDIDLVMNVSDRVFVMDAGAVIASGTPTEIRADPMVIRAYLGGHPDG